MKNVLSTTVKALAAVLLFTVAARAPAQTVFSITDEQAGATRVFLPSDSAIAMSGDANGLVFSAARSSPLAKASAVADSTAWFVKLQPAPGETLRPGQYINVGCAGPTRSGRTAGMEVTENNPICRGGQEDSLYGAFNIRQIRFNDAGQVVALEAVFTQRVGSPTAPAISGLMRYDTTPMEVSLKSDKRFALGDVNQKNFGDTSLFAFDGNTSGINLTASVIKDTWQFYIAPPIGQALKVGRYNVRNFAENSFAGLMIRRGAEKPQGCLDGNGTLDITELETDGGGRVLGINASFEYPCGSARPAPRGPLCFGT